MLEIILKNLAYLYYPKGICNIEQRQEYLDSKEYQNLASTIDAFLVDPKVKKPFEKLFAEFKNHSIIAHIQDVSLLHWQDRCLSLQVDYVDNKTLYKIHVNISLLIPYYCIYLVENEIELNPYRWKTLPKRNLVKESTDYKEHIGLLTQIIENEMLFNRFPDQMANIIIPDLSFNDTRLGSFTIYNAFFLDNNLLTN